MKTYFAILKTHKFRKRERKEKGEKKEKKGSRTSNIHKHHITSKGSSRRTYVHQGRWRFSMPLEHAGFPHTHRLLGYFLLIIFNFKFDILKS